MLDKDVHGLLGRLIGGPTPWSQVCECFRVRQRWVVLYCKRCYILDKTLFSSICDQVFLRVHPRQPLLGKYYVKWRKLAVSEGRGIERGELNYKDQEALFWSLILFTILCIVRLSGSWWLAQQTSPCPRYHSVSYHVAEWGSRPGCWAVWARCGVLSSVRALWSREHRVFVQLSWVTSVQTYTISVSTVFLLAMAFKSQITCSS